MVFFSTVLLFPATFTVFVIPITEVQIDPSEPIGIRNTDFRTEFKTITFHFNQSVTFCMLSGYTVIILVTGKAKSGIT